MWSSWRYSEHGHQVWLAKMPVDASCGEWIVEYPLSNCGEWIVEYPLSKESVIASVKGDIVECDQISEIEEIHWASFSPFWGKEDSIHGKSIEECFEFLREVAETNTASDPSPFLRRSRLVNVVTEEVIPVGILI